MTESETFLMEIDDAFAAPNTGIVVSGSIRRGRVQAGDEVEMVGLSDTVKWAVVVEIREMGLPEMPQAIFLVLQGVKKDDVGRGQVAATPGTIRPIKRFWAHIVFSSTKPRIDPQPFMGTFRSGFHLRRTDVYGTMLLPEGVDELHPGDQMDVEIDLNYPMGLEVGLEFVIGKFMGEGTVTKLLA